MAWDDEAGRDVRMSRVEVRRTESAVVSMVMVVSRRDRRLDAVGGWWCLS